MLQERRYTLYVSLRSTHIVQGLETQSILQNVHCCKLSVRKFLIIF
jgi:hypothetical protein